MKVLALDFDGVISNSIWDCFFTAYNVYLKFNPETKLLGGRQLTFENFNGVKAENRVIRDKFRNLASFAAGGKYFVVVFYIIDRDEEVRSQLEFDVFCSGLGDTALNSFQDEFYVERKRLQSIDMEKWYELTPPFFEVVPQFKKLIDRDNAFIVTNRDKESALMLLKRFGLTVDENKIIHKDFGLNKAEKLIKLSEKMNIGKQDIILVDDLLKHAMGVKEAEFRVFIATWGYSTEKQQSFAEQNGIPLLTEENFYETISKELER
ncbi:hypothetical protein KY361_05495 [Candidatus Woesearchaeota archaeon]|nr:hypothetical protein [Candidatus Woesearchaeota archaeon]